jgi:bla regulator protein blaR1
MDAIVSHIWQSTIFAAAAGMLALTFGNNGASVRYWIWFAAAAKFLVPLAALAAIANQMPMPQASDAATEALDAATLVFRTSALPEIPGAVVIAVIAVWLSGAIAVLTTAVRQWHRLTADARQSPQIVDGIVYDTLRSIERAEGVGTPITIVGATWPLEPGVIGIWKPVLMWPRHLTAGLSDTEIETVVAHEVCHIVRHDNLLASVQIVVTAVFWFHPIVWWIGARLIDERERACDERVLALGRRPAAYAESILKTCRLCIASPLVNVAGVTGGDLKQRIAHIMRNEPSRPLDARRKAAVLIAATVLLLMPTAAGVSACRSDESRSMAQAVPVQTPPSDSDREVNRPGGNVTTPRLVREVKPQYTQRAMHEKVQGEVLMECVVRADGTVGDTKVIKSLHPDLDQAALDAAAQWVFEPGTRNGKPVNVLVTIAMAFTLKKHSGEM